MSRIFSTEQLPAADRFKASQEWNREVFGPSNLKRLTDEPFNAHYVSTTIGSLGFCKFRTSPADNTILPRHRMSRPGASNLVVNIVLSGACYNEQLDNNALLEPDDLCVADNHYQRAFRYPRNSSILSILAPRERLESTIGPARLYAGMVIGRSLPGALLARNFFKDLLRVHDKLSPQVADRVTRVGVDLLVASLAERLAMEVPEPIHATLIVQRAKAYIETNLGDAELSPPQVAAAIGVSLRHLQQLFHRTGRHVSEWIWKRRLERAACWLGDPGRAHLPISMVAYGCGFTSLPHFSRRFRAYFDVAPTEYRERSKNTTLDSRSTAPH